MPITRSATTVPAGFAESAQVDRHTGRECSTLEESKTLGPKQKREISPRLLELRDRADKHHDIDGAGIQKQLDYECEAHSCGLDPDIPREDLELLAEDYAKYLGVKIATH